MKPETVSMNVKDLSEIGISIISPNDPSFARLLSSSLQEEAREAAEAVRSVSFFLKNDTDHSIIAYTIKWKMITAEGKVRTHTKNYLASEVLIGRPLSGLPGVIEPHSVRFISLARGVEASVEASKAPRANGEQANPNSQLALGEYVDRQRARVAAFNNITISLDGILLDNGTFAGPDTTQTFDKIKATLDARRDLLSEFERNTQPGKSIEVGFSRLQEIANGPNVKLDSKATPTDFYNFHQKAYAAELLLMRQALGDSQSASRALGLLHRPWVELKKR